jgi:dolichol-phosphate mannosyltransferase
LPLVSVVVPVYENAGTLPELFDRLTAVSAGASGLVFEFIFVDDGSSDESFAVLKERCRLEPRLRAIRLSRNFGANAAILAGLAHAQGDCGVVVAADLQDPPELMPDMIERWRQGAEVVLAARRKRIDPLPTKLLSAAFNRMFRRFVFPDFPPGGFDFVLLSRRVLQLLVGMSERNSYVYGQVMWMGFRRSVVWYDRGPRVAGESRWTFAKRFKYFVDAFTAFSYLPVRAASALGIGLAAAGFLYALVVIAWHMAGRIRAPGFSALMVVILIVSGVQLVLMGVIGEYLWRVLEESRRRPAFVVEEAVNVRPRPADVPRALDR